MNVDPIAVIVLLRSVRDLLGKVKVYKRRCRNLITKCEILISGLREGDGAVPAGYQAALNEAEGILQSIRGRVLQWTQLNTARSLLMQDDIRNGLDEYDRKIDACIATYNIKIGQQLAQACEQHTVAAQRDMSEIRGIMQDLLEEFTRYKKNPTLDVSRTNPVFRTVIDDIEEETREIQSALHDVVSEENDNMTQSSILSIDTFHRQMKVFSRSLVKLELVTSYVPSERSPGRDSSELTQSVGHQLSVSPSCPQLPRLNLGGNINLPYIYGALSFNVRIPLFTNSMIAAPSGRLLKVIKPETLESVIQYLLVHTAENDNEQRCVFFIAHPAFVEPLHVLRILTHRYDEAHLEGRVDTQARVLHLLNDWLNNEHVIFDDDILADMREFLASVNCPESEELDELVLKVSHGIREKDYRRPPLPIVSPSQHTQSECPAPCDLAIALAVLEGERYKRIVASEYMAYVGGLQRYCPNLSAAIGLNQLISKWVRSCILDRSLGNGQDGITARSKMKQYFVETAKECRKIRNFSSSGAIISALQSEVIARLTATQGGMSVVTKWTYGNLVQFFRKKCNYQGYREELRNQQKCSIPWHVVDLEDIQPVMQGDADTDGEHNSPQIHLKRWARLKQRAMSALHYHVPFTEDRQMAKEYLMAELQRVLEENFDQEKRSLILKAEEDRIMFKRAGFSPK